MVLVARRADRLEQLSDALSSRYHVPVQFLAADLTVESDLKSVEEFIRDDGGLDLLVNNAGFGLSGSFAKIAIEEHTAHAPAARDRQRAPDSCCAAFHDCSQVRRYHQCLIRGGICPMGKYHLPFYEGISG